MVFPYNSGNNFVDACNSKWRQTKNSVISKSLFRREKLQPKTIICEAQAKMLNYFETKVENKKAVQAKKSVR